MVLICYSVFIVHISNFQQLCSHSGAPRPALYISVWFCTRQTIIRDTVDPFLQCLLYECVNIEWPLYFLVYTDRYTSIENIYIFIFTSIRKTRPRTNSKWSRAKCCRTIDDDDAPTTYNAVRRRATAPLRRQSKLVAHFSFVCLVLLLYCFRSEKLKKKRQDLLGLFQQQKKNSFFFWWSSGI